MFLTLLKYVFKLVKYMNFIGRVTIRFYFKSWKKKKNFLYFKFPFFSHLFFISFNSLVHYASSFFYMERSLRLWVLF